MNDYELDSEKYVGSINTNPLHNSFWLLQPLPKSISVHEAYSFLVSSIIYEKKEKNK